MARSDTPGDQRHAEIMRQDHGTVHAGLCRMRHNRRLPLLVLVVTGLWATSASANDRDAGIEPDLRFDLIVPTLGLGVFSAPTASYSRSILTVSIEGRWTHDSGHGGIVRGAWGTTVWGSGYGADLGYLYRVRLTGDRDVSLGLDTMIGPTLAVLEHNEDTLSLGPRLGGHLSLSLDFRARNFILALGVQYRVVVPTQAAIGGGPSGPEHVLTVTLGPGFTFY